MNILYLTNHLAIGGITSYCLSLAYGLKKRGHNVYVASSAPDCPPEFGRAQINYIPIPIKTKKELSPKILFSMLKLRPVISEKKIDIIHANSRTTAVLGCLLGANSNAAFVSTCHGFFKRRFLRRVLPCWGQKTIAISQQVKEHLINDFKVNPRSVCLIPNGIDTEKFKARQTGGRQERKKELGLGNGPVVGIVARLSDVKGHIYLVRAMKDVLAKIADAQLLIVGDGKERASIEKLIAELNLAGNIFLIASDPDIPKVLSVMDLFALPSLKEGLGLSLMEAMAAQVPVIGSDIGGIRSLIEHNKTGLLVGPKDSRAIAAAILELLGDPDKAARLGQAAGNFIRDNFSLEKMVTGTEKLYLECLREKKQ